MKRPSHELLRVLGLLILWRLLLQLVAWIGQTRFILAPDIAYGFADTNPWVNDLPQWLAPFANWDSGWYLSIAEQGYRYVGTGVASNVVFFPLYPLLMRSLSGLLAQPLLLVGLIISHLCIFLAAWYLYKLVKLDWDEDTAWLSIIFLLLFPTSFFFISVYTESLFILLVILCFYFARRNNWALVGLTGFFVALTKPWGVALLAPLLLEYLEQRRFSFKAISANVWHLALLPVGTIVYMQFLRSRFGAYTLFLSGQKIWHQETAYSFWHTFQNYIANIFIHISDNIPYQTSISFDFFFFVLAILSVPFIFFFIRKSYGLYALLAALIPAISGIMVSMSRYVLIIFPLFILFARWSRHRYIQLIIVTVSSMLLTYFLILFVNNYWVA